MALDAHFVIDHIARNRSALMMNFNGTAGIWRRSAIEHAGGWQSDTLAEDLDLSYRAQLAGLKCLYLPRLVSPSQLPNSIIAFMQQQQRWAKGASQTFRKLVRLIIQSPTIHTGQKIMAVLHLSGYTTQLLFVLLVILSLPLTLFYSEPPLAMQILGPISVIPVIYYTLSQTAISKFGIKRMFYYPLLALLAISGSYNVTLALVDGFLHWGGEFIRTPKYNNELKPTFTYGESARTLKPVNMIVILYAFLSIFVAVQSRITHYIVPCILFLAAQGLYYITAYYERKKRGRII
jgi:cellulose synthase/poly-beta-1,6-N-acetylglucosamine synthase-like glycosyltransferase